MSTRDLVLPVEGPYLLPQRGLVLQKGHRGDAFGGNGCASKKAQEVSMALAI